jgi:mRNA-degrading endonuclease YafQ of YafQ-DinJ toxin-antitoxin module
MPWTIVGTNTFKRGYKQKTAELQAKVDEAIRLLVSSEDPRNLGSRKYGTLDGCYGHDIDFTHRMLFRIDMVRKEIYFLRVCSHKEVYGKS